MLDNIKEKIKVPEGVSMSFHENSGHSTIALSNRCKIRINKRNSDILVSMPDNDGNFLISEDVDIKIGYTPYDFPNGDRTGLMYAFGYMSPMYVTDLIEEDRVYLRDTSYIKICDKRCG